MKQYKHQDFKFEPPKSDRMLQLEETVSKLELQVQKLNQVVAFLERQDHRSRSSFESIQQRINSRK